MSQGMFSGSFPCKGFVVLHGKEGLELMELLGQV